MIIKRLKQASLLLVALLILLLSSCATDPWCKEHQCGTYPGDPYESMNRKIFQFDMDTDKNVLKPISEAYVELIPSVVREGVHNVYSNLRIIPTMINDVLQLRVKMALSDSWRFFFNSTVGLGGIINVAPAVHLPEHKTDFGETLGRWGYTSSDYLVLPFLGPSTVRDAGAFPLDMYMGVYPYLKPWSFSGTVFMLKNVDKRVELSKQLDSIAELPDPYAAVRSISLRGRECAIGKLNGHVPASCPPDF